MAYYIYENLDRTKTVVLTFLRSELLNDLDQYGYVEGDVMRVGDPKNEAEDHLRHGRHQVQDITQDGNIDLVTRKLDLKLAWCREALYPYTKDPVMDNVELDDILEDTDVYTIAMTVPDDFSSTTAEYLEQLIHNLLVWWVLYYWLSITKPEGAEKWLALAKDGEDELKGALARVCGRVYRRMSPFDSGTLRRY
ncbi:MAG: hypothetical protein SPL96_11105 [Bacteroidales bacterium]|nr:hypothetical protein [Bacteroidales bacterium]